MLDSSALLFKLAWQQPEIFKSSDLKGFKIGLVDLGTNSVRFDIHEIENLHSTKLLYREKVMVKLGEDCFKSKKLSRQAMSRTFEAFRSFKKVAKDFNIKIAVGVGTSALRDATNREAFLKGVQRNFSGLQFRVISGLEEAQLILRGIADFDDGAEGNFGFVDIGGGSTEIGLCSFRHPLYLESFNLGAARLQQKFLSGRVTASKIQMLRKEIRSVLKSVSLYSVKKNELKILGASGTIKAVHRILELMDDEDWIELSSLQKLVKAMAGMTRAELFGIPGMEPKRVDLILSGAILLEEVMKFLNITKIKPTKFSLRDGLLGAVVDGLVI